jgi:hypothetical protein
VPVGEAEKPTTGPRVPRSAEEWMKAQEEHEARKQAQRATSKLQKKNADGPGTIRHIVTRLRPGSADQSRSRVSRIASNFCDCWGPRRGRRLGSSEIPNEISTYERIWFPPLAPQAGNRLVRV